MTDDDINMEWIESEYDINKVSPRPWRYGQYRGPMCYNNYDIFSADDLAVIDTDEISEANAAHIVHCVNMHDELVEALEEYSEDYGSDEKTRDLLTRAKQ